MTQNMQLASCVASVWCLQKFLKQKALSIYRWNKSLDILVHYLLLKSVNLSGQLCLIAGKGCFGVHNRLLRQKYQKMVSNGFVLFPLYKLNVFLGVFGIFRLKLPSTSIDLKASWMNALNAEGNSAKGLFIQFFWTASANSFPSTSPSWKSSFDKSFFLIFKNKTNW